ncbi:oxidoreductase [Paenibacillus dendritiformis]|uniref:Gfo/Idh/MocA family protein n=1 Tax=Paenibacillus dendritiformis TaxID=130049 RepID=UPI001B26DC8E|nr:Gfo/Idh/MocA family oxidoreductase [Paenibacillus dendritiformis]GIO72204.1 oxidoreductase [Paenibacillus dendritiformis]
MSNTVIRTGIIGGSLNNQWASQTHIPALRQSAHHRIAAIATSRIESAVHSAAAVGAPHAFTDHEALSGCPEVDLVVVSVKVPFHYEAVKAAIAAGKHVYCEWPLAATASQAEELAKLADQAGIHHAIGLQARHSAAVQDVKRRLERDEIGRILSCTMHVSTQGKGKFTDRKGAYLLQEENGATLLAINGGHSLDLLRYLLGDVKELSAMMNCNDTEATLLETGAKVAKDTADQIMVQGTLLNGASVSVHIQGGAYPAFLMEIQGEKGIIRLKQHRSFGHVQFGNLEVQQALYGSSMSLGAADESHFRTVHGGREQPESPMGNVSKAHELLAGDIQNGTFHSPDFHDAVRLHQLLESIRRAAVTGHRQKHI